ncbi:zinc ribbon domain-containing protein [Burkholderia sp. S171]|uniref:zinc ribbon domain-containing protein n=1 Tax=Burkholderia sp. S171 TaxID=1641860 RepID=UPI00131CDCAF|nr:zinc ribbon domain-containing protein [Burkholderia sp. S171]
MARLFFPSSSDAVTCKRCGSDIPGDADSCPQCGAEPGPTFGAVKTTALSTSLRLPFGARREALNIPSSYPSMPEESELTGAGEQRWEMSKTVTVCAIALALVAGGVIYSQRGGSSGDNAARSEQPAGHSAYGAIDMKDVHGTPGPAGAPARPAAAARQAQTAAAPSVAAREAMPADTSSGRTAAGLAGATDNLQAAREAISRGDLTMARRRFSKIPASQLSAADVQDTQADLTGLEHVRDVMLQAARDCAATGSWLCVRQNAHDVLTIDAGNVEAQALVEHAIARSGWLNKNPSAKTAARGAPRNNAQAAAASAPLFVPGPRVVASPPPASAHRPTVTVSGAQHARAVAAMGVPAPIATPARLVPGAPVIATTLRSPVAPQAVPEPARIGAGSQAPLTSQSYFPPPAPQQAAPPRPPVPAFVPMPDGTDAMPATALVRSAPVTATARAPAQPEPAARRALASGDNAASPAQPRVSSFNASNPDDEERAILESGWSKSPSSAQHAPPQ